VAVSGGGRVVADITTGASPLTLTEPFADVYVITTGGTSSVETINLPAYGAYADANVGKEVIFSLKVQTTSTDNPVITYTVGAAGTTTASVGLNSIGKNIGNLPVEFILVCDGQYWQPQGWRMSQTSFNGNQPNVQMSGFLSYAEGQFTVASNIASHAEGDGATASGPYSHAEGNGTTASGIVSHAEGQGTTASGPYSHAEGDGTTASGPYSHAEGSGTTASGDNSHAEGGRTTASGPSSHAEGLLATDRGITAWVRGANGSLGLGKSQQGSYDLMASTFDGTSTAVLCTDNSNTPSATNQVALPNGANSALGAAYAITGRISAVDPATGNMASWNFSAAINQGATAASTVLLAAGPLGGAQTSGPVALTATYMNATWITAASVVVTLKADTTNGAFQISVVGVAATTIEWLATVDTTEVTF